MKTIKFITTTFLLIASLSASAGWEPLPFTDTDVTHYIDKERIDRNRKPYPGLWVLIDYGKTVVYEKHKSVVMYVEFNCQAKKSRISIAYAYEKPMGQGKILNTLNEFDDFHMPPPSSPPEYYRLLVCNR